MRVGASRREGVMTREAIEKVSKALGDETRLLIFEAISGCDHMNCGQIVSLRGVTPATVSHHLKVLSEAELIECRREGQFVLNSVNRKTVMEYTRAIGEIAGGKKGRKKD
jgi:ArsR family transcriptional regulator